MAIHIEQQTQMQGGRTKKIDTSGIGLAIDAMQKYQYNYPVKSTVREILCNGIDAVREKYMAHKILTGEARVEDFFENLEGELYEHSKWNPSYYDLKYLDLSTSSVQLTYTKTALERDLVIFEDRGVGLGDRRLEGYFDLTFSTKRLSKEPLGKWGVGAKSPLSLGIPYYIMESWHNGRYFKFQIYEHQYFSLIPKFDLERGVAHEFIRFSGDTDKDDPIYWQPTTEPNGVRITVEAKKHQRQQYIDAVKSQMLYFPNIDFHVVHEDGRRERIEYKANILYEDDLIVMSDNNYYSKPHLLLNGVNYGYEICPLLQQCSSIIEQNRRKLNTNRTFMGN